jgi:hypothetical protein
MQVSGSLLFRVNKVVDVISSKKICIEKGKKKFCILVNFLFDNNNKKIIDVI